MVNQAPPHQSEHQDAPLTRAVSLCILFDSTLILCIRKANAYVCTLKMTEDELKYLLCFFLWVACPRPYNKSYDSLCPVFLFGI
jgi:hypothetical protein